MLTRTTRHRRARGRAPIAEINVTPLVDVMMVLLVIFMVTAPLLKTGIPIALPASRANPLDSPPKSVTISLGHDGKVYLDDAELAPGELADRIAALPKTADGKPPAVVFRGDRGVDYGRVIALMGELNHAGITSMAMMSQRGPAPSPSAPIIARSGAGQ